jgi:hypothetical protein
MQLLPKMLMEHATKNAPRRPSLSAMTPPLTAPNMAPRLRRETNKEKTLLLPPNSDGRQSVVAEVRAERGPVRPMDKPNESAPQATRTVKSTDRLRDSVVKGVASSLAAGPGDGLLSEREGSEDGISTGPHKGSSVDNLS